MPLDQQSTKDPRPDPALFFGNLAASVAGITIGVLLFVLIGLNASNRAIAAGTYAPNMAPGMTLFFIPLIVLLVSLLAFAFDSIIQFLVIRSRNLVMVWHRLALGLAYSLMAMPLALGIL